jgi:hypothetical protein
MNTSPRSLHSLVDKWLAPTASTQIRVTRFRPASGHYRRYVCVETERQNSTLSMFFFRHDDGWCVFPPNNKRMSLGSPVRIAAR